MLRTLASRLPRTAMAGFETQLKGPTSTPDVSIRATRADFRAAARAIGPGRPRQALELLVELCERNTEHWYFGQLPDVWLEFDARESSGFSAPSIFFATSKANTFSLGLGPACPGLLRVLLSRLTDAPVGDAHGDALDRCFAALDDRDFVGQLGCMLGRGVRGIRVLVEAVDPIAYLRRLALPIDIDAVTDLLKPHDASVDKFLVSLDVDGEVRPRVGLEFIVAANGTANRDRWAPILRRLVEQDLCTEARAASLLRWCGVQPLPGLDAHRRGELSRVMRMQPVLERRIGHVKAVFHPEHPPSAKAYYGYEQTWSPRGSNEDTQC